VVTLAVAPASAGRAIYSSTLYDDNLEDAYGLSGPARRREILRLEGRLYAMRVAEAEEAAREA
jgi:hypothetical protein